MNWTKEKYNFRNGTSRVAFLKQVTFESNTTNMHSFATMEYPIKILSLKGDKVDTFVDARGVKFNIPIYKHYRQYFKKVVEKKASDNPENVSLDTLIDVIAKDSGIRINGKLIRSAKEARTMLVKMKNTRVGVLRSIKSRLEKELEKSKKELKETSDLLESLK